MASGDAGERLHFAHFKTARGGGAGAGKRGARTTLTMSSMISRLRAGVAETFLRFFSDTIARIHFRLFLHTRYP
jgi:hypothetical protein